MTSIHQIKNNLVNNYQNSEINITDNYTWSMNDTVEKIHAYISQAFANSQTEEDGSRKHFYDIVDQFRHQQFAIEDLDTKDMVFVAENKTDAMMQTYLLRDENRKWMKETNFAETLNKFTRTTGDYGTAIVRTREGKDGLNFDIMPFTQAYFDPTNIKTGTKCWIHYMTPSQLMIKAKDGTYNIGSYISY